MFSETQLKDASYSTIGILVPSQIGILIDYYPD